MYALSFGSQIYEFPVGHESIEVSYPARTGVAQAFSAFYVDHFGPGAGSLRVSGTTGWGVGERKNLPDGKAEIARLARFYTAYNLAAAAARDPMQIPLIWADGHAGRSFQIVPDPSGLSIQQSKGSPLTFRYSLSFVVLRDLSGGQVADAIRVGALNPALAIPSSDLLAEAEEMIGNEVALEGAIILYELQPGESLHDVAEIFGVTVQQITELNGIRYSDRLNPGFLLRIPLEDS